MKGDNLEKKVKTYISWRTAPRSISVLLSFLPYFNNFQGEVWKKEKGKKYTPLRRKIRWQYEYDKEDPDLEVIGVSFEEFSQGKQVGKKDKESLIRQQFTTAEQFGFMGTRGEEEFLYITEAGGRIINETFTSEDFLVQLIKMYVITNEKEEGIFPFQIFIRLLDRFKYLSRMELTYLFGVTTPRKYDAAVSAIEEFRLQYEDRNVIENKQNKTDIENLLKKIWNKYLPANGMPNSWVDYSDAFLRALLFTEMFNTSGRGIYTKIRVKPIYQDKFNMLLPGKYEFEKPIRIIKEQGKTDRIQQVASRDNLKWYGAIGNISLPWDNFKERQELLIKSLSQTRSEYDSLDKRLIDNTTQDTYLNRIKSAKNITTLKDIETEISNLNQAKNMKHFIEYDSKTKETKLEIIDRFSRILDNADMSALWLEVNTWKSLVSLNGEKNVIPNFKMEQDLTPKSFAPGKGNTPDMEVHTNDYIIVPEVSLMSGKTQWEHEGSSVIDHVLNIANKHKKNTIGLFISKTINYRTMWQFFILIKNSWLGEPIPVIPITIDTYSKLITSLYGNENSIDDLFKILVECKQIALRSDSYIQWQDNMDIYLNRIISSYEYDFSLTNSYD